MAFLLISAVIAPLAWANVATVQLFRSRRATWRWWAVLSLLWLTGVAIGVWGGFFFEYQASPTLRVFGAPIPAAFFHLEGPPGEELWMDYISPAPLLFAGSNVILIPMLLASPVGLIFWARSRMLGP